MVGHGNRRVRMRTKVMNQLQAIAMYETVRDRRGLRNQEGGAVGVVDTASLAGLILVQNSLAAISTKRILTIVIPGKIMA